VVGSGAGQHELSPLSRVLHQYLVGLTNPSHVLAADVGANRLDQPSQPG
jgi:hypothetical protein